MHNLYLRMNFDVVVPFLRWFLSRFVGSFRGLVEDPEIVCKVFVFGANMCIVPLKTN